MHPDTIVLPERWNTGFFPKDGLSELSDCDETRVKAEIGTLAKELHVNIVAGSVSNKRGEHIYNTALVFDREGSCIYSYDKIHLFTPAREDRYYTGGERYATFFWMGALWIDHLL